MGSPIEVHDSLITLPLTRRLNSFNGTINLLQHDKDRMVAFRDHNTHGRRANSIFVRNKFLEYTVSLGVGRPATIYDLLVDSGSSITWVGATTPYVKTGTSINTEEPIAETYGSQDQFSFSGTVYLDTVTLGDGLTVIDFPLGVASTSAGFSYDGVLGIGPDALSVGTLPRNKDHMIPTFTDYLYDQGKIGQRVVGIFFQPSTTDPASDFGELAFGGPDYTKSIGNIVHTPITTAIPASDYWGIDQSITYGTTSILDRTAGIVDTGTTFLSIASDAFARYKDVTGGTLDEETDLLRISSDQYDALRNLDFHIGDEIFSLTPNAQIWPRSLNTKIDGGDEDAIYLIVNDNGKLTGQGFDFINGYTFIQRFYILFDGSNSVVGFAKTRFTYATTN